MIDENKKNEYKKLSDEEFMKQLEKQIADVKQMFLDYEQSKKINIKLQSKQEN